MIAQALKLVELDAPHLAFCGFMPKCNRWMVLPCKCNAYNFFFLCVACQIFFWLAVCEFGIRSWRTT